MRALPARRMGEGQPPGDGPLRQVLRTGPALPGSSRDPGDQGPHHADGRVQGRRDRLHHRLLTRTRRQPEGAEPACPDHERARAEAERQAREEATRRIREERERLPEERERIAMEVERRRNRPITIMTAARWLGESPLTTLTRVSR